MSIHSIAKELGVSEYFLKNYAKLNNIPRDNTNRCSGYKFTQQDLKKIKELYLIQNNTLVLMFRIYREDRNHLFLPAGFFGMADKNILEKFVSFQYQYPTHNDFKKKCYNFFICTPREYTVRINKLEKAIGPYYLQKILTELNSKYFSLQDIQNCIEKRKVIKLSDFASDNICNYLNIQNFRNKKDVEYLDDMYYSDISDFTDEEIDESFD